jgi:hypothetical protein
VTAARKRLREDAVNLVFAAHLGFDPGQQARHSCVFVNLEQLGEGAADVPEACLKLLQRAAVVDDDPHNVAAYAEDPADVPIVPLLSAPCLKRDETLPPEDRPVDLLFIGSLNERRRAWIDRIEALGHTVMTFDKPMYGEERKVCTRPHAAFETSVLWVQDQAALEQFFSQNFLTPACCATWRNPWSCRCATTRAWAAACCWRRDRSTRCGPATCWSMRATCQR